MDSDEVIKSLREENVQLLASLETTHNELDKSSTTLEDLKKVIFVL